MLRDLSTGAVSSLVLALLAAPDAHAATTPLNAERIKAALHTAAPEDDGFVDRAVEMVQQGKLSASVVQSTFVWARNQSRHKFQHFKRGLIVRAPNQAVRTELVTGRPPAAPPPTFGAQIAARLRRLFSFLPSVRALLK